MELEIETPVLVCDPTGQWYVNGLDSWVCRPQLSPLFVRAPKKISLSGSTRPDKWAVKVELIPAGCGPWGPWVTIDGQLVKVCDALWKLANQFLDEGHKTIYVTLWKHE